MYEITLTKRCKAAPAEVFAAWSEPSVVSRWFAPGDLHVAQAEIDFRVGGRYRIVMQRPDGGLHIVGGEYRCIVPHERLSFSWAWEGSDATTEVELCFEPVDKHTDLTLTHREFQTDEARVSHQQGWEGCLAKLLAQSGPLN
jgi:uncharacterized protein YndB with AHSA1/START domain